jgi:HK97 family phage prohead protease/HK97 family phage major capsid protein
MMNKLFNLTSTFKSHEADDGSVMIRGMASTADFDRAGDSISAEAWTKGGLQNFEKNPIILFNHDYDKPIGRATGLKAGPNGLELECKISKAAPANVAQLVKDGVLGAFSVGFRVKDADYIKETDGLMIKDAELFEVSVVSVPCNQSATFSLAKSFDSDKEYEEFKKTFTNRVDLAGQSLAKDEVKTSSIASETPVSAEKSADQEIKMDNQNIDLEAFAKQVAEDTAAKIAMKQAEQKAAEEAKAQAAQEAEEAKALEAESIKSVVSTGVNAGVETLMADVEAKLTEKDAKMTDVINSFQKELEEKTAEIAAMQASKRDFSGRQKGDVSAWGKDFLNAHVLGKITGKGYDSAYAQDLAEKAGVTFTSTSSAGIDVVVSNQFETEVRQEQKLAGLFREIPVTSGATVLPVAPDTEVANFASTGAETAANNLEESGASDNNYNINQVILQAHRLISSTFISNDTDEQTVVALLPIITSALARAHAKAIDSAILVGAGSGVTKGLVGASGTDDTNGFASAATAIDNGASGTGTNIDASTAQLITPAGLMDMRSQMGKYGINASEVAFVVPNDAYYQLIDATGFTDVSEVGSDLATKLTGMIGTVFGSPVIASDVLADNLAAGDAQTTTAALAVNTSNYVIPRLRDVSIETDYIVKEQRNVIVASQALGFNELVAASGSNKPAIRVPYS